MGFSCLFPISRGSTNDFSRFGVAMQSLLTGQFFLYGSANFTWSGFQSAQKGFKENIDQVRPLLLDIDLKVDLEGRSFLVSGANSGLGLGTAMWLAKLGGTVHMLCRNSKSGEEAKKSVEKESGSKQIHCHTCDLNEPQDVKRFVEEFTNEHRLDVLVLMFGYFHLQQINNAGVLLENREVNSEGICSHLATNALGPFYLTMLLIPLLRKSREPRVIFVSAGGMLTQPLLLRHDYDQQDEWNSLVAYARAKVFHLPFTLTWFRDT